MINHCNLYINDSSHIIVDLNVDNESYMHREFGISKNNK